MIRRAPFALVLFALLAAGDLPAQQPSQPPPPAPPQQSPAKKKNTQPAPTFEPFKAEKSVEIGMFYLKKKNYDAAIERFLDATRYKPGFARPHLLLGRAYEGKREWEEAIIHYTAYLEIVPQADDAKKVRVRIEQLRKKVNREKARRRKS